MSSNDNGEYMEISRIISMLPYADQLDSYADAAAAGLKESLRRLLTSSTYASHRCQFPALIHKYIEHFGMRFNKKEAVDIIKFGLSLFYCPQVDKPTRDNWGNLLYLLIFLSNRVIPKKELQLDWKIFRDGFIVELNEFANCDYKYEFSKLERELIRVAKKFFTASSVQEIWDFERAQIYTALGTGSYDKIFLPLHIFTPTESRHFEEIKRVWLDEIFHMWYQYPAPEMHIEVVNLLALLSHHFPGRLDMEPHLGRIFNFLISYFFDSTSDSNVLRSSALIIANSIVPGSNILKLLRNLFHVCKHACHITSNNTKRAHFPYFCYEIVNAVASRLHRELHWIPEMKDHIADIVDWAKLTREQVDEFVDIVLPSCLEVNIYMRSGNRDLRTAYCTVHDLAYLRPRLVIPRLIESIEEGFLTPQLPMRVSRPLKALASSIICLVSPCAFPLWAHYIGNQPTDQLHNYPMSDPGSVMQTPEQRKYISSHLSAIIYPEGRTLIPRILNVCLAALDVNHSDRLLCSIRTLDGIFKTMPIKDLSTEVQTDTEDADYDESLTAEALKNFSPKELSRASLGVEDIVVVIYKRILHIMESENESAHFHVAANETEQNTNQFTNIFYTLSTLGCFIAISASTVPRLRVRLVRACLDTILQNQWSPVNSKPLGKMLLWLLSGPRGDSDAVGQPDSDIALFALNEFWPHFKCLYSELKSESSLTHKGKVEPRFLSLVSILKVFFFTFIPTRLEEVKNDFIYPAIEVLFDLLAISLGSEKECPPSKELADYASDCLSGLLYRLLTFSVDFSCVDFYNIAGYATDPMWTPFVGYQKAHKVIKWLRPDKNTHALAEYVLRRFLLPLLDKLSTLSEELSTYLGDGFSDEQRIPQISRTSGQSRIAYQQSYLISLTSWISNIGFSILEGLKPRNISHEDAEYVNEICTQLELMRHEIVASPTSSNAAKDVKLDIPFFDLPSDEDGFGLRDQIFRIGMRFLDVVAKLSIKFDSCPADPIARSSGQSVIGNIYSVEHLRDLMNVIGLAGFNYMDHNLEQDNLQFSFHLQSPIIGYYSGFFLNYIEPEHNFTGISGPSSELLSALAGGKRPSLGCGGGGLYGKSYLPITWIMCVRRQHFNFARRALGLCAAWPGSESASFITFPRLPANREIIQYVETSIKIALNCYKKGAQKLALDVYIMAVDETPGVHALFARLFMEIMRPFYTEEIHASSHAVYRACSYRLKRVILTLRELVSKTNFLNELYNNDPALWSEMWLMLAKLCIYTDVTPTAANTHLTPAQIRERYNEQAEISQMCALAPTELSKHLFTLYFHTSYDPDAHPSNAPLRYLILSAQNLLKTLRGCEDDRVKHSPPLLEMTGRLRRDAYRYLAHKISSECLEKADMNTNSNAVIQIFCFFSFRADHWDNSLLQAALPEGSAFRFTAPPPPPPPVSMIKMVLRLLTSQKVDLASASGALISRFLKCYLLRTRNRDFICVDPSTVEIPSNCKGYENEHQYDCLSPENFTLKNHILSLAKSSIYFRPLMTWVDPCSNAAFPTFSGPDKSVLESDSNDEWLKVRLEMDLSVLIPEDISNWQEGVKAIAQNFASPEFWTQLSQTFLNYHRCSSRTAMEQLKQVIFMVFLSFGPHPYLQRVEDFLMSLLQPALTEEHIDGIAEFVGPTMVTEILQKLALGSRSWTREMRLQLYGRVIPRLIVCSEAAVQLASTYPFHESPSIGLKHVELFKPLVAGLGIAPSSSPSGTSLTSFEDVENSQSDYLANKILYDNWDQDESHISEETDSIKLPDPAGPKIRIASPVAEFFKSLYVDSVVVVYSSYIWKFICELASEDNEGNLSKDDDTKSFVCGHRVPAGDGECPVCLGRRLFPRLDQRRAIKDQMMTRLAQVKVWDSLHLLKHFVDTNMGSWEKKLCGNSLWTRQFATTLSRTFISAGFHKFRNYEPATLRLYPSGNTASCKRPESSEHQLRSILESKLISRLATFEAPELRTMALVGRDFFMRRYLPLLVRDWMSILLLKGFLPSEASFALQNYLISIAIERLTPATEDLLNCSQRTKFLVAKQIAFRLHCLMYLLVDNIWSAYPMNALPDFSSESTFEIFYRLAPLLADYAASSDYFWTAGLSKKEGNMTDPLDRCINKLFYRIGELAIMGHTNSDLVMTQANRMMDFFDVFLLHSEWKTRMFGLILMRLMVCHVSAFWKTDEAAEALRVRSKRRLCDLLADPWIDVAQKASNTLTYALQLSIFEYDDHWFRQLAKQSRQKLISPKAGDNSEGEPFSKREKETAMLRRHAGVLGLCSIIRAHPHDTPDYLPAVIAEVASHSADPYPIAKSVSDTLMEYSRNHTDQWATRDRAKFTEEQLEAYTSVVSGVSYYV